jgi:hypothetical protein
MSPTYLCIAQGEKQLKYSWNSHNCSDALAVKRLPLQTNMHKIPVSNQLPTLIRVFQIKLFTSKSNTVHIDNLCMIIIYAIR